MKNRKSMNIYRKNSRLLRIYELTVSIYENYQIIVIKNIKDKTLYLNQCSHKKAAQPTSYRFSAMP